MPSAAKVKPLSTKPSAVRQRRLEAKRRDEKAAAPKVAPGTVGGVEPDRDNAPPQAPATPPGLVSPSAPPLHDTQPIEMSGSEIPFAARPVIGSAAPVGDAPAEAPKDAPPIVPPELGAEPEPPPAPPPPSVSEDEAATMAMVVRGFVEAGTIMALMKHPELRQPGAPLAFVTPQHLAGYLAFVEGSTKRLVIKWNINFAFADEAVVALAVGVAAFGMFGKPSKGAQEIARAEAAKDANVQQPQPEPNGATSAPGWSLNDA